ncbi:MAG: ribosome-associated translation inhibitor RaiA [Muribaculaceae bacterium]|nr:ribosome-associated translation inhibitor RaiA [Muribaculaceae bacterium]MDE6533788.1 ribosome-associated translation inhibitor RaiA [Muribaculaceae bacterium]
MEVQIKAIHFDISEKLVAFVNKKIDKLTRRYDVITDAEVNLRLIKPETANNKEAGIKLSVPGSPDLFASKTADSFEEAIDLSLAALEPQLEKVKDKNRAI